MALSRCRRLALRQPVAAWETSLFPERKSGTYLFAIKAAVRRQEDIAAGDTVTAVVQVH